MRYLIAALLGYFAYGSFGLVIQNWRVYGCWFPVDKLAIFLGSACVLGALCLVCGWGV